jgi:hypothetical protein
MKNGPLLVHTGRLTGETLVRVRYRLRPEGISSRASEMKFIGGDSSRVYLCSPRSSGSSFEVLITLVCTPLNLRQAYTP